MWQILISPICLYMHTFTQVNIDLVLYTKEKVQYQSKQIINKTRIINVNILLNLSSQIKLEIIFSFAYISNI